MNTPPSEPGARAFRATVAIPTYRRSPTLRDAVASVCQQSLPHDQFEILVVDNNPQPELRDTVDTFTRDFHRPIRYLHEPRPGLHRARHAAAAAAPSPILALIDDDVLCAPRWLEALLDVYDHHGGVCVGGPVYPQWDAPRPDWLDVVPPYMLSLMDSGPTLKTVRHDEGIFGCNFSVRIDRLYQLGGFNPECVGDRWLGDGESGLLKKLADAGDPIHYAPEASVLHRVGANRMTVPGLCHRYRNHGADNSYVSFRLHHTSRPALLIRATAFRTLALAWLLLAFARRPLGMRAFLPFRLKSSYYAARASYDFQLIWSSSLREFARRQDWIHEP
jgi:glycosyltransferase involved in cell wall biosynthesis